jgi:TM2 domain-containing membrane protein YozV
MQPKSKLIAGILGVTLGAFGIHSFYLGKTNRGILQIVVTVITCGIGALWGIIEGIMIFAGVSSLCTDASGQPLYESQRFQIVAGLLGLFLGGFGIHNFYLGKRDIAIIQIVVTVVTGGVGALWGIIEGVLILMGTASYQTDANGQPLIRI